MSGGPVGQCLGWHSGQQSMVRGRNTLRRMVHGISPLPQGKIEEPRCPDAPNESFCLHGKAMQYLPANFAPHIYEVGGGGARSARL